MPRSVKVVCFALAIVGFAAFAASCGSSNADFRVFNAIATSPSNPTGSAFDIWVNGSEAFSDLSFGGYQPSSGYKSISAGTDTLELFQTGTTSNPYINSPLNLGGSNAYTVILTGTSSSGSNYAAAVKQDTNPTPTTGNVNIRIINAAINASQAWGGSFDFYILPPGTTPNGSNVTPQVSQLTPVNASPYQAVPPSTGNELNVYVTAHNSRTPIQQYDSLSGLTAGTSIRTIMVTDSPGATSPPVLSTLIDVQ